MQLLPINLGCLADNAEQKESGARFSLASVLLKLKPEDNTFTVYATDSKHLVRATGPCVAPASEYPSWPEMDAAPNGKDEVLIPVKGWKRVFSQANKVVPGRSGGLPVLTSVAVQPSEKVTTFGARGATAGQMTEQVENVEGRFPPCDDIIRTTAEPVVTFAIDPKLFCKLLKTVAELGTDDESKRVEVTVYADNKPIHVRAENRTTGLKVDGLIMPLIG